MGDEKYLSRHVKRGERTRIRLTSTLLVVILLGLVGAGGYFAWDRFSVPDYSGAGIGTVRIDVPEGSTLTDIGVVLRDKGVVKSVEAFTRASTENPRGQSIQAGSYNMREQMSGQAAVERLLDPVARIKGGVTIPEGKYANQVYATLAKATDVPLEDFIEAGKDPLALGVPKSWFQREDGQKVVYSVEGFLFPDTYEFKEGSTAEEILKEMVKHFLAQDKKIGFSKKVKDDLNISPYEGLIVASLAQAEAGNPDDLGKVARVAYNRVYSGDFPCDCLEFDVGINYYYQLNGKPTKPSKKMSREELRDTRNPYRLHGKSGLTPTPINNPGAAALQGAADPPKGGWLFFVAIDKEGHSAFAETDAQHEVNKEKARKAGII